MVKKNLVRYSDVSYSDPHCTTLFDVQCESKNRSHLKQDFEIVIYGCQLPVNVDVDKQVLKVVDGESVQVGVGLVHLNRVQVLVRRNVFGQLKFLILTFCQQILQDSQLKYKIPNIEIQWGSGIWITNIWMVNF